ncbi:transcription factor [Ganoderma sinense ZZ0214-1]|uniref:Transcription factor n=1 Tax=Ganoderma sinense ZZ0214-1 TaxID=1077348 RepID=A0A2G8SU87_9APHY|nr:transcription factor [Ganoderma sinense ZZ0214-1]
MAESYGESLEEVEPQVVRVMEMKKASPKKEPKPKNYSCKLCFDEGKSCAFSRRPDLTRHISSVHNKNKPFKCPWPRCKRAFSQKASLATHRNTHTRARPWVCGTCFMSFGDQSSCARHQREQHARKTHFCPYCTSTNKRASDFQNHLFASHKIEKGSINTAEYRWSIDISLESLEEKPQFKLPGMSGIAMRRSHPPPRARGAVGKTAEPVVTISGVKHEDIPFHDASQSYPSYPTTPASSLLSLSPSPSSQGVGERFCSPQASPYPHGNGNALGMEFGIGGQYLGAHPQTISRTSSAASCLGGSESPMLTRASSASSVKAECHTPDFRVSATLGVDQKAAVFKPYTIDGSPYMTDSRGQAYYPMPQTFLGPYAHHGGQAMAYRQQFQHYLPGGLGISHTIRSRAHFAAWSSQESFN